jgi:hypothetical protein
VDTAISALLAVRRRIPLFQRAEDSLAGRLDGSHQFDDDVDVVAGHQLFDIVGEQLDRHATVAGHPAHPDAAQHGAGPRCGRSGRWRSPR